ncbi:hypothetical protein ABI59_11195 [Acidobacteria bacterium Mor1]|nr:hypothetical protein ABI59_11195 [Acidobacteria bacterium Mor1]
MHGTGVRRTVALSILAIGFGACGSTQPPEPLVLEATQALIQSACEEGRFSGVVRVRHGEGRVFEVACGQGVAPGSLFKIFSTSKQITAAVVMAHVDSERLRLGDTLGDHVAAAPEAWSGVTVESLLRHRSGLPDLTGALLEQYRDGVRDHSSAMAAVLAAHDPEEPPDAPEWAYNNFGYELLTLVAESADSGSFEEQAQRLIFDPAGMTTARFEQVDPDTEELQAANTDDLVQGYNGEPGDLSPARSYSFVQRGAGALHMSAADLSAYLRAYRSGHLLSPQTVALMVADPHPISETTGMGLGWFIRKSGSGDFVNHSGGTNGYVSLFGFLAEGDLELVIVSNYGFAEIGTIRDAIFADLKHH